MASTTYEMVNIGDAFERHKENKSKNLYILMSQLKDPALPSNLLLAYLKQLRQLVTILNKDFEVLVGFIFKIDWTSKGPDIVEEYLLLVKNIVTVHSFYLTSALKMIIEHLKPNNYVPGSEITAEVRKKNSDIFQQLHGLLAIICKTIPMAHVVLVPLLADGFPFYLVDDYILECYIYNLLVITSYLQKHRVHILQLVISEITKIDVHVPANEGQSAFNKSVLDIENPVACKLDVLMSITLAYVKDNCYIKDVLDIPKAHKLLGDLLQVFETVLLPTYASRFVQFVMFYICSFHESLAAEFVEHLWKKFEDPNVQRVFRQIAVLYIASYLVRAKTMSTPTVKVYIDKLVAWIRRYIQLSPQNSRPDVRQHGPFYSACQALFYVFIYRHEEILHKYGLKYCESLYFGSVVTSWLNPLRVCLPQVALKFASVVRNNRVAFCDTVLDRNRRYQLPEVHSSLDDGGASSLSQHVEAYFPFDPFTLPRSSCYIVDVYRNVESLPTETRRHRTISEDVRHEEDIYMECDDNTDLSSGFDLKLYGTSPGLMHCLNDSVN